MEWTRVLTDRALRLAPQDARVHALINRLQDGALSEMIRLPARQRHNCRNAMKCGAICGERRICGEFSGEVLTQP